MTTETKMVPVELEASTELGHTVTSAMHRAERDHKRDNPGDSGRMYAIYRAAIAAIAASPSPPADVSGDTRVVRFMGIDPLNIGAGAVLPMIPDSWRFAFTQADDGSLMFSFRDDGPLVAFAATPGQPADVQDGVDAGRSSGDFDQKLVEAKMRSASPVTAWLHQVVGEDGEPDQALSFAPDNFPLQGVVGYRSLSHAPLYLHPAVISKPTDVALNVRHIDCHKAADAFWTYWRENGETHKHGYYESTWGAINAALRLIGVVPHTWETTNQGERK